MRSIRSMREADRILRPRDGGPAILFVAAILFGATIPLVATILLPAIVVGQGSRRPVLATGVWGAIAAAGSRGMAEYDAWAANLFENGYVRSIREQRDYGAMDWGDWWGERGCPEAMNLFVNGLARERSFHFQSFDFQSFDFQPFDFQPIDDSSGAQRCAVEILCTAMRRPS